MIKKPQILSFILLPAASALFPLAATLQGGNPAIFRYDGWPVVVASHSLDVS
jgi:hypothetical protein